MLALTNIEILQRAKARIERGWCKQILAKDQDGANVEAKSLEACTWCLEGALEAEGVEAYNETIPLNIFLRNLLGTDRSLYQWNDDPRRTKQEVLALLDRGIAKLAEEETNANQI